jgi:cell division protein FtsB
MDKVRFSQKLSRLYDKYATRYVVVLSLFVVWVGFLDGNSVAEHIAMRRNIRTMEKEKARYEVLVRYNKARLQELRTNDETFERFARERYLMRAPDEDMFIIIE